MKQSGPPGKGGPRQPIEKRQCCFCASPRPKSTENLARSRFQQQPNAIRSATVRSVTGRRPISHPQLHLAELEV
jgi:hypothetical protein